MTRRMNLAWTAVVLVALVLSWIALGHTGPMTRTNIRLMPFPDLGRRIACLVSACSHFERAALYLLIDILGNVVVFAPFGAVLFFALQQHEPSRMRSITVATAIGMVVSILYETAQLWIPGRVVATDDVILNTLGAALGAWATSLLPIRTHPSESVSINQHDR